MPELHDLSAAQQLNALRAREISSRDLTQHYLDRIDRLDAELGAFVTVVPECALEEAARADEQLARGEWAPLTGLPIGLKDLHPTAGLRTTFGSAALADLVPADDAWTVGLIRQAGAVVLGKTNAPEFGATCFTENDVTPRPAVTPYALDRYSSGSSGGAATAVAAGLLPVAHGSDGAGSTRTPAATCHLVGVKPSRGLVSPAPATGFFSTGIEGPIARTVQDAAVLLDVMAHPAPGDLYGWSPGQSFVSAIEQQPQRLRVAVWTATGLDGVEPHPESAREVRRTADALTRLGHDVQEIDLPAPYDDAVRQAVERWFGIAVATGVPALVPADRRDLLTPYTRHLIAVGQALSGVEAMTVQTVLARFAGRFLEAMADFDVALTPATNGPAVKLGHYLSQGVESVAELMLTWSCYTPWANLTGSPAVALPSGVQLVGHRQHDAELLALAAQMEAARCWDDLHPPCW